MFNLVDGDKAALLGAHNLQKWLTVELQGTKAADMTLPPLPYDTDALEPHIDNRTMSIHYDKHYRGTRTFSLFKFKVKSGSTVSARNERGSSSPPHFPPRFRLDSMCSNYLFGLQVISQASIPHAQSLTAVQSSAS